MKLDRDFWLKLAIESFLIVFSVLLALALNEYMAARKEEERTRQSLLGIREELRSNRSIIQNWHQIHQAALKKVSYYRSQPALYDSLVQNNQFQLNLLFEGTLIPNTVRSNSWEIAKSTGLLQNFDLSLANGLTDMYDMQGVGVGKTADRLISLIFERQTHLQEHVPQTLVVLEFTMQELVGQESYLIKAYEDILNQLDAHLEE